ncbi:TlpA family protein disulfide reductase [Sedimentibacter saalensis]|jgi:thiol-disulfide isomerase/thioredoxin|uniref:Thiol-disulfide isomerase/thioredoxin n=1 Tax=Sedimentibacter saalensis TaxID=130788 RepID=A0A562J640_9FIRM|nr:TlpA disulfide reductase family protein [Sedimentibacter saalensis]MEA5093598.1 TlpA disulfide reductase family protein [Sedimentibacter saalensis]TWH78404.1 thiol-disulfide isomerase/thioredoxin [Sedimentibacter saalensis]
MKKIIILALIIALIASGCSEKNETEENKNTSTQKQENPQTSEDAIIAPDFELESLDGTTIKLSEMRDKNVIINFWATWCGYCVIEMPDLQKLQETYKDDLLVLTVNVGESKEIVQKFMEENNLNLTVVLDKDMAVSNNYGIRSYPTTIAVNKKGEAVRGYVGMLTYEQMELLYDYFEE